jgi:hypothetical protein
VTPSRVLAELEALAARLGVAVRVEAFGQGVMQGRGGLCWVDGKALVVMDQRLSVADRIAILARALSKFDVDAVSVAPAVRDRIASEAAGKAKRRPAATPKRPGLARARPRGR